MLQRAASNAYSWWWASHIRTKQSKWLEQNLQDMDEKVKQTLKLIEEDGDSFAKRAEMYYRKRPELINFVEEFYRAYRALAERYDHISGELQNANHTIATVFPEQVQLALEDEEDDEEDSSSKASTYSPGSSKLSKGVIEVPKSNIPKVPEIPMEKTKGLTALLTKKVQEKTTTTSTSSISTTSKSSGMSKPEALGEIDKLQKGILALQTEKEFLKSSYEIGLAKYWEIEKQITEMQEKVFMLQDEFSIGTVIEDDEARNLMAATALKSCEETLIHLQEKQERSAEEARAEYQRVKDAHKKLETLKDEFFHDKTGSNQFSDGDKSMNAAPELKNANEEVSNIKHEKQELEFSRENMMEKLEASSNTCLTVTEMAERIDELVNKVFTLEHAISSQTALIKRLRSETDDLHVHIRSLEDGKATLTEGSNALSNKLKELEEELHGIQDLNHNVDNQNSNLQTHFSEAHCNLDYLSQKLQTVKPDEDAEIAGSFQEEVGILDFETPEEFERQQDIMTPSDGSMLQNDKDEVQNHTEVGENTLKLQDPRNDKDEVHNHTEVRENILKLQDPSPTSTEQQEDLGQSKVSNNLDDLSENCQHSKQQDEVEKQNSPKIVNNIPEIELPKQLTEQDEPNWKQLFLNGLEDREKILLGEYTSILRNYKELKKKLSEVEKKNRDSLFEVNVQMRELKSANAMKDDEIQSLHQKLNILAMNSDENISNGAIESKEIPHDCRDKKSRPQLSNISSFNSEPLFTFDFSDDRKVESTARINALAATEATEIPPMEEEEVKVIFVDETHGVSTTEEKFRMDIDALLEENLDFWLRFSTSFHQIQKFQTGIQDLQAELSKLKENKKQDGSTNQTDRSLKSDVKPIYKHLREIQTELTLWLEQNALLKEELQYRFSSLCNIQEEIARVTKASSGAQEVEFTSYQAAKFQGEVLNMKQENNKVADELQAGLDHVKGLQVELERTLSKLNEDLGLSESKNHHHFHFHMRNSTSRPRIPLRSFLFGVKSKKQKPSIFSCMNPALQKQYSDLRAGVPM